MAMRDVLALDRQSVRTKDIDGKLHVALVRMTKANVCPYLGREIPDYQALGLKPDATYRLYRDAEALQAAVPTANGLPVLSRHEPVTAEKPAKDLVVGSTGTDAKWDAPYITNSLVVWDAKMIALIESDEQKELSSAYRYRAIMEPGKIGGDSFDGRMVDIKFNHLAIVEEGRAGPDVVIGDSKENVSMANRKLAAKKAKFVADAVAMAKDGKFDALKEFLDAFGAGEPDAPVGDPAVEGDPAQLDDDAEPAALEGQADPSGAPAEAGGEPSDPIDKVKAFLKGKLSDEDMKQLDALVAEIGKAGEAHEEGEEKAAPMPDGEDAEEGANTEPNRVPPVNGEDAEQENPPMVTKPAMDAAIAAGVAAERKNQREIREAERAVRPYVGEIAIACDSAAKVYRSALKMLGVKDVEKIHESALPTILSMHKVPGKRDPAPAIAVDSKRRNSFAERFPDAARIRPA